MDPYKGFAVKRAGKVYVFPDKGAVREYMLEWSWRGAPPPESDYGAMPLSGFLDAQKFGAGDARKWLED
jgi:hypothetical protein